MHGSNLVTVASRVRFSSSGHGSPALVAAYMLPVPSVDEADPPGCSRARLSPHWLASSDPVAGGNESPARGAQYGAEFASNSRFVLRDGHAVFIHTFQVV